MPQTHTHSAPGWGGDSWRMSTDLRRDSGVRPVPGHPHQSHRDRGLESRPKGMQSPPEWTLVLGRAPPQGSALSASSGVAPRHLTAQIWQARPFWWEDRCVGTTGSSVRRCRGGLPWPWGLVCGWDHLPSPPCEMPKGWAYCAGEPVAVVCSGELWSRHPRAGFSNTPSAPLPSA